MYFFYLFVYIHYRSQVRVGKIEKKTCFVKSLRFNIINNNNKIKAVQIEKYYYDLNKKKFCLNIFKIVFISVIKAVFPASLLQSSVSHDLQKSV